MVLTAAELAVEKTKVEQAARLSRTYASRGQSGASSRFNAQERSQAVAQRESELNPSPQFYNPQEILASDREAAAAKLRAQAAAARETAAQKRSAGKSSSDVREYEDIAKRSDRLAENVERDGFDPNSNSFRKQLWQATYPNLKGKELERKYLQGADRRESLQEARDDAAAQEAGYESAADMRDAQRAGDRQAAVDQRNRFVAGGKQIEGAFGRYVAERGYNPRVTETQRQSATVSLLQQGKASLVDPVTSRAYQSQGNGVFVSVRTQSDLNAARNQQAVAAARSGDADYQDTSGRLFKTVQPSIQNETLSGVDLITQEGAGETPASFSYAGFDTSPKRTPFADPFKTSIQQAQTQAREDSATYFKEGGLYVVPGAILKGGEFSLGIAQGAVQETQNVRSVVSAAAIGALVGGAERSTTVGSRSSSAVVRTASKGTAKVLPIINLAAAGAYVTERGYSGAKAADEGRFGEFVGQTAVQLVSFGIGSAAAKTAIAPRELTVRGNPTSPVVVEGYGDVRYTGIGQEVNAPVSPLLVRKTTFTERADGYLGRLGPVRTRVVEFGDRRVATRDVGGTAQNPTYRVVSVVDAKSPTVANGVPLEAVRVYKKGQLVKTYTQTAEDFGRVSVSTSYNVDRGRQVTSTNLVRPRLSSKNEVVTERFRKELRPTTAVVTGSARKVDVKLQEEKSIVGQTAGEERIITIKQESGRSVITGKIGVGTRSDAVSFTRRADVQASATPIERTFTADGKTTVVGEPQPIFKGSAKVNLQVTESPLKNEFTTSTNRVFQEGKIEVNVNEQGASAVETIGAYAGVVQKPFIETIGFKRVAIAGVLEVKAPEANPSRLSSTPIVVNARRVIKALNAPRLRGEDLGIRLAKVERNIKRSEKSGGKTQGVITTSGDINAKLPIEPTFVSSIESSYGVDTSFSVPAGSSQRPSIRPSTVSPDVRQESTIRPEVVSSSARSSSPSLVQQPSNIEQPVVKVSPSVVQETRRLNTSVPVSKVAQVSDVTQVQKVAEVVRVNTQFSSVPFEPQQFPPPTFPTSTFGREERSEPKGAVFDVEVRRDGKFRVFSTQGLRLDEAVRLGETVTDTTAARSFQIVDRSTGQPIGGETRAQAERFITPGRYREAKGDKNIFVEKSKFAINTGGEKLEIRPKRGVFGEATGQSPFGRGVFS